MKPPRILTATAMVIAIVLGAMLFDNKGLVRGYLSVPFFSGAANFELGRGWMFNEEDTVRYMELPAEAHYSFRAERAADPSDLRPYIWQESGYVYICLVARNLFFWLGDLRAIESLQVGVHILLSLFLFARFRTTAGRVLIFLLYGLNPLLLYLATFPTYYYWQVVPTSVLLAYLVDRDFRFGLWAPVVVAVLALIFVVRPTMMFASALLLVLILLRESPRVRIAALVVTLLCAFLVSTRTEGPVTNPWHTAYIGIGNYPNPHGIDSFTDIQGLRLYYEKYGVRLRRNPGGNYHDEGVQERYRDVTREAYLEILRETPFLLLRNAIVNFCASFAIGAFTQSQLASYASALLGFMFLLILVATKRFFFVAGIVLSSLTYVAYTPPIPVYGVGTYPLVFGALVEVLIDFRSIPVAGPVLGRGLDRLTA